MGEDAKVALRNERRNANEEVKKAKKDSTMTEDEATASEKLIQDVTDKFVKNVDAITDAKNKELMESTDQQGGDRTRRRVGSALPVCRGIFRVGKDTYREKKTAAQEVLRPDANFRHIAFIMDGNGRWAKKRGMPREYGHKVGSAAFKKGVPVLL